MDRISSIIPAIVMTYVWIIISIAIWPIGLIASPLVAMMWIIEIED